MAHRKNSHTNLDSDGMHQSCSAWLDLNKYRRARTFESDSRTFPWLYDLRFLQLTGCCTVMCSSYVMFASDLQLAHMEQTCTL